MKVRVLILRLLYLLALVGLAVSCVVHAATFFAFGLQGNAAYIFALHLGGMVVLYPALFFGWRLAGTLRPGEYVKRGLRYAKPLYRRAAAVLVGYGCIAGFASLVAMDSPVPHLYDNPSLAAFSRGDTLGLRLFTCGWIVIYSMAAVILDSAINAPEQHDTLATAEPNKAGDERSSAQQ